VALRDTQIASAPQQQGADQAPNASLKKILENVRARAARAMEFAPNRANRRQLIRRRAPRNDGLETSWKLFEANFRVLRCARSAAAAI